jgi:hypothetical protein
MKCPLTGRTSVLFWSENSIWSRKTRWCDGRFLNGGGQPEGAIAVLQLPYTGTTAAKWLFHFRGPQRQVFVAGVEVKATSLDAGKCT